MKRIHGLFLLLIILGGIALSCSDTQTYAEQLANEKSDIKAFMKERGYTVTTKYPDTIPFPKGVFYKTESGLYIHVLDTGAHVIDTIPTDTPIEIRYLETSMDGDTTYSNMYNSNDPYEIFYNNVQTSTTYGDCKAWHEGLTYVGDGGWVYMIVPSKLGMSAYSSSTSTLVPCFYELRYKFWDTSSEKSTKK